MTETSLEDEIGAFTHDPLGYVLFNFPWGEGELKDQDGPRPWQREALKSIGEQLRANSGKESQIIQEAFATGHGPGKSALACWLMLFSIDTCPMTRGVVTANKASQLKNKTWAELAKWNRLSMTKNWHTINKTSIQSKLPDLADEWRIDAETWTKENTEAFAGLHNAGKRLLLIFDEASGIDDKVWEVAEGALTDPFTEIIWLAFGNPTRNSGRFRECFTKHRSAWSRGNPKHISILGMSGINQENIKKKLAIYGDDSDYARVRVYGEFPKGSELQFIATDIVDEAEKREPRFSDYDPLIMTLDIARGGNDFCVFGFRRGYDAQSIKFVRIPGSEVRDSTRLVSKACEMLDLYKPDHFVGDETGVGGPILNEIARRGYKVFLCNFGKGSPNEKQANMRSYMWQQMKEWLYEGGAIADHNESLKEELCAPEYHHRIKDDALVLQDKDEIKDDLGFSTDHGDALAMTFYQKFAPRSVKEVKRKHVFPDDRRQKVRDYNPLAKKR